MSYELTIENKYGDQLKLTQSSNYKVKATGLNPVNSDIITASVANYGGERYVSSRQQKRNIVLTIFVCEPVETNRINLYKYIKSHDWIRVYFKNNSRNVYIDGYVESFELNHFDKTQTAQVSIICPQPNFIDMNSLEATNNELTKAFHFKFNTEVKTSEGSELEYNGLNEGVVKFTDFLAVAKTDQKQYSGKNLVNSTLQSTTASGVTITNNGDGTYTLNGTATDDIYRSFNHDVILPNGEYKLIGSTATDTDIFYTFVNALKLDDTYEYTYAKDNEVFVADDSLYESYNIGLGVRSGSTLNNVIFKPMITADLEATYDDFEPYCGGSPSPSPTYPEDITGLGVLLSGDYYTHLNFSTAGTIKEIVVPLGEQTDNINLIKGGASLVCDDNYLIGDIYTDDEGYIYIDENDNTLCG